MSNLWNDLKHSLRMFAGNPGFTLAALAALALGIGVNTAIFTVVDTVLLKPLTYPDSGRIVMFMHTDPQGSGPVASVTDFHAWEKQTGVVQAAPPTTLAGPGLTT